MKNVFTQGPSAQLSARGQGLYLALWHGHRAPILGLGTNKKVRSHWCSAQNRTRAPSVNTALAVLRTLGSKYSE